MSQSFFHQNLQFARLFTKKLNEQLTAIGLFHSQWLIVYYLKQSGPSTLVEISQYINVEKPTVSRTVDRLEKSELIEKIPSKDRRERRIQLTEKGKQVYQEAILVVEAFEQTLLEQIPQADMEITFRTIKHFRKKLT
ncbi:MarR family winged helix-turn-helix transcriptional regulator [Bacillus benzoevorans]|uniref:DNA-binding MarR family transcriptional regulator n=1 Tax=Bacillus benzoevorans TaxID=1456 RepID=A0A7X0HRF8_9BACI|nr:MarR family transcriptional regulator [Bacillus benzoevorans]MBB6444245.1 DNA-binding MarR family transcriptional regulator [Bacillus benzoevorans]